MKNAVALVVVLALVAPAASRASAYWREVGLGSLTGAAVAAAGAGSITLYEPSFGFGTEHNVGALYIGVGLIGLYPAVMSSTIYAVGEARDGPSENKFAARGLTTLTAYGVPAFGFGLAWLFWDTNPSIRWIPPTVVVLSQPFVSAWVYNKARKPRAEGFGRRDEPRPSIMPSVSYFTGAAGNVTQRYGFAAYF